MKRSHPGWGGAREGAGRKPKGEVAGVSHMAREDVDARFPVLVTLAVLPHVWDLTSARTFRVVSGALDAARDRLGLRVCEFRVQDRRLDLLVEANSTRSLARGMQGLSIRIARALNGLMSRKGKVFSDRYDARILRTTAERRDALRRLRRKSVTS